MSITTEGKTFTNRVDPAPTWSNSVDVYMVAGVEEDGEDSLPIRTLQTVTVARAADLYARNLACPAVDAGPIDA